MRGLKRGTAVSWAFYAAAFLLIGWRSLPMTDPWRMRAYSQSLFPHDLIAQYRFMGISGFALLLAFGLCYATAWGVGHQRNWSRWTGLMPGCFYVVFGFPYLSAIGLIGVYFLWTQKRSARRGELTSAEFWNPGRQSGWLTAISILTGGLVASRILPSLTISALQAGLPVADIAVPGPVAFITLILIHIAIHELGHALAAVAVDFRVRVIAVGPFVFSRKSGKYLARFDWKRTLSFSGYMGSVPVNADGFRIREVIVIAAGPAASLLAGGFLLAVSALLPGTPYEGLWRFAALGSMIGFCMGVVNLVPLGFCDGTMLLHLLFRTHRGDELITLILRSAGLSSYKDELSERQETLRRLLADPNRDPIRLGRQYIAVGKVEIAAWHRRDGEAHITQGLALVAGRAAPDAEASAWESLHFLRMGRHDHTGATEAYRNAVAAHHRFDIPARRPLQRLVSGIGLANLHVQAHAWDEALEETDAALAACPDDEEWRMPKGGLLAYRAQALLQSGRVEAGLEAVNQAAAIFRTQTTGIPGPQHLGILGRSLWNAGRTEDAITLTRESIALLEERGEVKASSSLRLFLANMLCTDGRLREAACVLPPLDRVSPDLRGEYYERRAAIRRREGKLPDAIADLSTLIGLTEERFPGDEVRLAEARAGLAEALADNGDSERAELLASQARDTLAAAGHPDFARACITLALIGWHRNGSAGDYVDSAVRAWSGDATLLPATKARKLEEAARSLELAGFAEGAFQCRQEADRQCESLGVHPVREELAVPVPA